jgi:hypothetical protein
MGTHMKTTMDINDALLEAAREIVERDGITMRSLVEEGLRHMVAERHAHYAVFTLRDVAFDGRGLQPALVDASWERLRDLAYGHEA